MPDQPLSSQIIGVHHPACNDRCDEEGHYMLTSSGTGTAPFVAGSRSCGREVRCGGGPDRDASSHKNAICVEAAGRALGSIRRDRNFPRTMVGVCDSQDRWVLGTPFAVMEAAELRAWAAAFTTAADDLEAGS